MPRKPRIHFPGAVYHVILRGNAGQFVFFHDRDRLKFYLFLQESIERFGCRIHGFCCMTNHIHLILQIADTSLSVIMQNLSQRFTKWINFSQQRTGHIFQGRFKALLLDADGYLLELVRYVHLNPVRAGMVDLPEQYPWSGHRAYLGQEVLPWLTTEWVLSHFGPTIKVGREAYRGFVDEGMNEERRSEFHSGTCEGRILGDDTFVDDALNRSNQHQMPKWEISDLVVTVCNRYGITVEQLKSPGKKRSFGEARALAAVMALEAPQVSLTGLGCFLHRDVSTLSKAAQRLLSQSQIDQRLAQEIDAVRNQLDMSKCRA
jgi:putative transposase